MLVALTIAAHCHSTYCMTLTDSMCNCDQVTSDFQILYHWMFVLSHGHIGSSFPTGNYPRWRLWLACRFWSSVQLPQWVWWQSETKLPQARGPSFGPRALRMNTVVNHCQQHIYVCLGGFSQTIWEITSKCWEISETLQQCKN